MLLYGWCSFFFLFLYFVSAFHFDRCNEMYVSVEQSRVLDTSLSVFRCFPTHTHMFIIYRMQRTAKTTEVERARSKMWLASSKCEKRAEANRMNQKLNLNYYSACTIIISGIGTILLALRFRRRLGCTYMAITVRDTNWIDIEWIKIEFVSITFMGNLLVRIAFLSHCDCTRWEIILAYVTRIYVSIKHSRCTFSILINIIDALHFWNWICCVLFLLTPSFFILRRYFALFYFQSFSFRSA